MSTPTAQPEPTDFSLVLGGPLYQLFRRARLSGDALELLRRRILIIALIAWLPLLVLSFIEGHGIGNAVKVPFLYDVDTHARFLLALPLLILAELVIHQRLRPMVGQFVNRGLVPDTARPKFDAAIASAMRWRNSVWAEGLLMAFVYLVGVLVIWRTQARLTVGTWYGVVELPQNHRH